jgi:hypothetical protein
VSDPERERDPEEDLEDEAGAPLPPREAMSFIDPVVGFQIPTLPPDGITTPEELDKGDA